ncbi:unnamed protein product [Paramecium sonneborni]|uniref:Uncharacterized protein n=1 Tax=Paramecium sonneborni TaxID=65129 RepID=A0A8S1K5H2_9CILI|nr:unnamed protein product [Paramecium sonneborni]
MQSNNPQNNSRQTQIKLPIQLEEQNLGHTSQVPYAITKNPIVQRRESKRKTST